MKNIILFFFLMVYGVTCFADAHITSRLQQKMNSMNPVEFTRALVVMKDQANIEALDAELYARNVTLDQRAYIILTTLKSKALATQGPILYFIETERSYGKVKQYIPFWVSNMVFIETTTDVLFNISKRNDVEFLDLDAVLEMDKPVKDPIVSTGNTESVENGLKAINADSLWRIGITGAGRTVMNIDGGVNGTHPALGYKWWGNNGRQWYHSWFDPIAPVSTSPFDCAAGGVYHGTHTMGIMCGRSPGTGDTIGVAPDAFWIAAGVTDCPGASYPSMNIAAFQWAMDPDTNVSTNNMPDVINCSWRDPSATDECSTSIYRTVLTNVEAAGIAVVFSAGNSGPGTSTVTPPKNINMDTVNVFCVGAVNGNTAGFPIASFSSRGPSLCGGTGSLLIKPEVTAPGVSIRSSYSGSSYAFLDGTSMASPHVAGAVALLKQAAPTLTGKQIKSLLFNTCTDLGAAGEDNTYGKGIINVWRAYLSILPPQANDISAGPYLSFPSSFVVNTAYNIRSRFTNIGTSAQSNVPVKFFVNGVQQGSTVNIPSLPVNGNDSVTFSWTPTSTGVFTLKMASALATDGNRNNDTVTTVVNVLPAGIVTAQTTVCRNGLNKPILDMQTTYDTININIPNTFNVVDVNVKIDTVLHTYDGDLTFTLSHLAASSLLINRVGGTNENFIGTILNDSATTPIASGVAPYTGSFIPSSPLSSLNGVLVNGDWVLSINDAANIDVGTLKGWCLTVTYQTVIGIQTIEIPSYYSLDQNYPNPFNPSTTIKFSVPKADVVKLKIYDVLGREVAVLVNELIQPGFHTVDFNASNLASGIYFYKLEAGDYSAVKKLVFVK
ncbi:MAG: S8 family serine peptidase [Ignavibacteria bacterium]|nr:S8 family serine peptidase [Ignavibacteria bacterium]